MKQKSPKIYRSSVGRLPLTVLLVLTASIFFSLYYFLDDLVGSVITALATAIISVIIYFSIHYQIVGHSLKVSTLFSKKDIDIFQISSLSWVQSFNNQPNVYSFSEIRLRIVYCYGQHIDISPQHSEEFIETLLAINPMIQLQNEPMMQE